MRSSLFKILFFCLLNIWFISSGIFVSSDGVNTFDLIWKNDKIADKLENTCPNNRTKCTNRQTCCPTKHNSYHCCRYPNAVCCPDKYHCCPEGTTCDSKRKRCSRQLEVTKAPVETFEGPMEWPVVEESPKEIKDQMCANNHTRCKDTQTCCITKHGSYHCCKFENAVCCSDKYHCCPEDSTCDLKRHRCIKSKSKLIKPMKLNVAEKGEKKREHDENAAEWKVEVEATCPNNKTKCKDTKTCCITKHGNYYCCPHKNAVCCPDKYNCCPEGTVCDLKNKKCKNDSIILENVEKITNSNRRYLLRSIEALGKLPSNKRSPRSTSLDGSASKLSTMICPDGKTECFTWETCCPVGNNEYGCCSYENATCCADQNSCCRQNEKCDLKTNTCEKLKKSRIIKASISMEQFPLISFLRSIGLKSLCSNTEICHPFQTCCKMRNDLNGCCPYSSGVCCSDLRTCCPSGSQCIENGCA